MVRFVIVTGMSGAGRSSVLRMLEDIGYLCIDNLPVQMISGMTKVFMKEAKQVDGVALGIDIRNLEGLSQVGDIVEAMKESGYRYEILFLEADNNVLIKRYKETRRNHPLALQGRVDKAIEAERAELAIFLERGEYENFFVTILSFGFKYGIPEDADLVFDVRFLPNPYYIAELKHLTGNDREVYEFVMGAEPAQIFSKQLFQMISFLIPKYVIEGKNQLVIGVGCTGGKHRSVSMANTLAKNLEKLPYGMKVEHRDIEK